MRCKAVTWCSLPPTAATRSATPVSMSVTGASCMPPPAAAPYAWTASATATGSVPIWMPSASSAPSWPATPDERICANPWRTPMTNRTLTLDDNLYRYLLDVSLRETPLLKRLRDETAQLANAQWQIAPEQGQFMALLVQLSGARRIFDVGTFTG